MAGYVTAAKNFDIKVDATETHTGAKYRIRFANIERPDYPKKI